MRNAHCTPRPAELGTSGTRGKRPNAFSSGSRRSELRARRAALNAQKALRRFAGRSASSAALQEALIANRADESVDVLMRDLGVDPKDFDEPGHSSSVVAPAANAGQMAAPLPFTVK